MKHTPILTRRARQLLLATTLAVLLPATAAASEAVQPREPAMYLQLIEQMQAQGAWFASLAHIQAYRQQHGDSPALQLRLADALRQTEQDEQAAEIYRRLNRGPTQAAAAHGLGLIAMAQGQTAQALEHLGTAARLSPLKADYLGDLGYAHLLSGNYPAARAPLAQAAELNPGDGRSIANLALWQMLVGNNNAAEQIMRQAQLPASTQQAVAAQAVRLRQQQMPAAVVPTAASPSPTLADTAPATTTVAVMQLAQQPVNQPPRVQPPVSMLERFAPSTSSQQGNTP